MKNRKYIVVASVSMLLICILVYHNMNDFEKHYIAKNQEKIIDLNSVYDENSIIFEKKQTKINEVDCFYIQLDGLKKAKVENNINKSIKKKLNELTQNHKGLAEGIFVKQSGNFGNILSIIFYIENQEEIVILDTLNYNLVNGEELKLNNLFTSTASIEEIIDRSLSDVLLETDTKKCEVGNKIEESDSCLQKSEKIQIYLQQIKDYKFKFYFNQFGVYIIFNDLILELPYYQYADSFSLHYKYLTNVSIYKDDSIGKKEVLIASYRDNGLYSVLDYTNENTYTDSVVSTIEDNIPKEVIIGVQTLVEQEIINTSNTDSTKFIFLNQSGELTKIDDAYIDINNDEVINKNRYNIYTLTIDSVIYEVEKDYFEENLKNEVYTLHRQNALDSNFINISEYSKKQKSSNEWTILANGTVLDKIEDLFIADYDYKQAIKRIIMGKYNLPYLEVSSLLEDSTYNYNLKTSEMDTSYCIVINTSNNKRFYVSFDEFDKNVINVY